MRRHLSVLVIFMMIFATAGFASVEVGVPVMEKFETPHPYKGGPGLVMEKIYHFPNAGYISLHFQEFDLAPGDYVEIMSGDETISHIYSGKGKVVQNGKQVISEFWASHIPGDTTVVRLYSYNPKGSYGFVIDRWVRGFEKKKIAELVEGLEAAMDLNPGRDIEAICSSDDKDWAKCHDGTEMYNKARAVARLLMNGSTACTGWLLGSEGHLMTNNHCISSQNTANNTDYEFMAEGANCTTNCASWFACPGNVVATSGTMVKTNSSLDYSLILLPTNLTGTYGYLQFRDTLPSVGERIYIPQHPGGWGKQIAVTSDTDGPFCQISSTNSPPCSGGPGDIGYYCDTAGGSSGSPVLGYDDNLVVALHHCANCPNRGVPIPSIISDLGGSLPNDAIGDGGGPGGTPPAAPNGLNAKARGKSKIRLTWNDNSNNENGFDIYRGTSPGSLSLLTSVSANTTSYTNTGLSSKTTYYYQVCAVNNDGQNCSGTASATTK